MINYELAKKLKDAGFENTEIQMTSDYWLKKYGANVSLSELIEACGDKFESLVSDKGEWKAYCVKDISDEIYQDGEVANNGWCKTPIEAVANLWLEINKK